MSFLNDDETRLLKAIQLNMLLDIASACGELGIDFFLDSGTLLGAARHQGFIPWDDDIDIGMMRDDYAVFLEKASTVLGDEYVIQNPATDPCALNSFAKVRKKGTRLIEALNESESGEQGIWIDILPFDVVDSSPCSVRRQKIRWQVGHKLYTLRAFSRSSEGASMAKRLVRWALHACLSGIPLQQFRGILENAAIPPKTGDCSAVTCFHYFTTLLVLPVEDAFPLTTLSFEGYEMPVFAHWEEYLKRVYGDWKQLPPKNERKGHSIVEIDFGDASNQY